MPKKIKTASPESLREEAEVRHLLESNTQAQEDIGKVLSGYTEDELDGQIRESVKKTNRKGKKAEKTARPSKFDFRPVNGVPTEEQQLRAYENYLKQQKAKQEKTGVSRPTSDTKEMTEEELRAHKEEQKRKKTAKAKERRQFEALAFEFYLKSHPEVKVPFRRRASVASGEKSGKMDTDDGSVSSASGESDSDEEEH